MSTFNLSASTCPANTPAALDVGSVALEVRTPGVPPAGRKARTAAAESNVSVNVPPIVTPDGYTVGKSFARSVPGLLPCGFVCQPPCVTVQPVKGVGFGVVNWPTKSTLSAVFAVLGPAITLMMGLATLQVMASGKTAPALPVTGEPHVPIVPRAAELQIWKLSPTCTLPIVSVPLVTPAFARLVKSS